MPLLVFTCLAPAALGADGTVYLEKPGWRPMCQKDSMPIHPARSTDVSEKKNSAGKDESLLPPVLRGIIAGRRNYYHRGKAARKQKDCRAHRGDKKE